MTYTTELIGQEVLHGSPGYENPETIEKIVITKDAVEIEFASGFFTLMTPNEFEFLLDNEELDYNEKTHGGMSTMLIGYAAILRNTDTISV